MRARLRFALAAVCLALVACGGQARSIPGTRVPDSQENRDIIRTIEAYRLAVERQDGPALLLMASEDYWEDGGTPRGDDDYGYQGLKEVLASRFQEAESIRYSIRYMRIRRSGNRAFVDVLIDASYTIRDARGELVRRDKRDQNQIVLEWNGERWKFLSGM